MRKNLLDSHMVMLCQSLKVADSTLWLEQKEHTHIYYTAEPRLYLNIFFALIDKWKLKIRKKNTGKGI